MTRFSEILQIPVGITALVGGGGKTSLMMRLAKELSEKHTVLMTTTTHIRLPDCYTLFSPDRVELAEAFLRHHLVAAGEPADNGKLAAPQKLDGSWRELAEYVLVEADGSRGLPLKAPAEHEPVLPSATSLVIAVAGMSCLGQTIRQSAHRPERYAALAGLSQDAVVTPQAVADVLEHACGQRKGVESPFLIVLNQADNPQRLAFAQTIARVLHTDTVIAALQTCPDCAECWRNGICVQVLNESQR